MLDNLLERIQPTHVLVAFDAGKTTFRTEMFADYKAGRAKTPEEFREQFPYIREMLAARGIAYYDLAQYEADDIIGTLAKMAENTSEDYQITVVSGDKDLIQLTDENTVVEISKKGVAEFEAFTPDYLMEKMGITPAQFIDLKALMGDTSDNIPGVPGVGEKTAMALVQRYGSIDEIYRLLPDIEAKPAAIRKLQAGEDAARHSYWLATIVTDAPLAFDPAENVRRPFRPELYDLLLKLEFQKLIDRYGLRPAAQTEEKPDCTATAEELLTVAQAEEFLALWRAADCVAVYALPDLSVLAVECEAADGSRAAELYADRYEGDWQALLTALFSGDIKKAAHNVKDLMAALLAQGLPIEGFVFDTALAAYLLDATAGSYDLQRLFVAYYNEELPRPVHLEPDAFSMLGDRAAAAAALLSYTAAVAALRETLAPKLRELELEPLYYDVELPLCAVLARMEQRGFLIDRAALAQFGETLQTSITQLEQQIYAAAGAPFNINSPKQLGKVLFEDMQLPHGKKTKTGWSTNADVLDKLRGVPIVADVLQYRQYAKLKSTYADGLLKAVSPDGRIRTSFQMTVTATGRLSSTEPNLQNIPTRTELGSQMRRMFVAAPGNVLVDADYSQIELRLLAHISGDEAMCRAFRSGEDFHTLTAARVFHVEPQDVTPEMRRRAKAVNFGVVYGISPFSLSQDIGVTVAEAKEYMERYFQTYTGVRAYMDRIVEQARADGYVETLMHRRRALPELKSSNHNLRAFGERVALNMPIQGTAADLMKLAMVRVERRLADEGLAAQLIMQVHDELIVECPEDEAARVQALLEEEMSGVMTLAVPLPAEAHCGKNWLTAKG